MTTKTGHTHTAGPWYTDTDSQYGIPVLFTSTNNHGDKCHGHICTVDGGRYEESKANARLIATAPELLEAAKHALGRLKELGEYHKSAVTCMALQQAISKATGDKGEL